MIESRNIHYRLLSLKVKVVLFVSLYGMFFRSPWLCLEDDTVGFPWSWSATHSSKSTKTTLVVLHRLYVIITQPGHLEGHDLIHSASLSINDDAIGDDQGAIHGAQLVEFITGIAAHAIILKDAFAVKLIRTQEAAHDEQCVDVIIIESPVVAVVSQPTYLTSIVHLKNSTHAIEVVH